MEENRYPLFSNAMVWFGAAVSIAEIMTGTLLAPLGLKRGLFALLLGHLIGCVPLFLAGLIGAQTRKSAMETVALSFGHKGAKLFSALNVMQLAGWTAVMIAGGAAAASAMLDLGGDWVWCLIIGALIALWSALGLKRLGALNTAAMALLFALSLVLSYRVLGAGGAPADTGAALSFGEAVELSAAMPLSWLPLIADYTRFARKKALTAAVSTAVYCAASCWMYGVGLGAALLTGTSEIASILLGAGLGFAGLLIVVLSTVTTTFLDVYSAGVSAQSLWGRVKDRTASLAVCAAGTALAIFTPGAGFESFLYLIGSVFAPMIAIQIADRFLLGRDRAHCRADGRNLALWAVGFALYRAMMAVGSPLGSTLPVMAAVILLCVITDKISGGKKHAGKTA